MKSMLTKLKTAKSSVSYKNMRSIFKWSIQQHALISCLRGEHSKSNSEVYGEEERGATGKLFFEATVVHGFSPYRRSNMLVVLQVAVE